MQLQPKTLQLETVRYRVGFNLSKNGMSAHVNIPKERHLRSAEGKTEEEAYRNLAKKLGGKETRGWVRSLDWL